MNAKNGSDIPLGLGMALMQNPDAFFWFSRQSAEQQQKVIDGAVKISSRDEMKSYVSGLNMQG